MIELNSNSIEIGQIKQILANFNLPLCQVGETLPKLGKHFITKDSIKVWKKSLTDPNVLEAKKCSSYIVGNEYKNLTSRFVINNLTYDRETHRYLGKYLRFLRDYYGLNLMSMYNCFDEELNDIDIEFTLDNEEKSFVSFSQYDSNTISYKIPVSIIDNYTISTHSSCNIELCLAINKNTSTKDLIEISKISYLRTRCDSLIYYNPYALINENYPSLLKQIYDYYDQLYLVLKVPSSLSTSITILEGTYIDNINNISNYITYRPISDDVYLLDKSNLFLQEYLYKFLTTKVSDSSNNKIYLTVSDTGFPVASQLLSYENLSKKYLLGDRLIEYLTGNAISIISDPYDIKHVQKLIDSYRYDKNYSDILIYKVPKDRRYGIWNFSDTLDLRSLISKHKLNLFYDSIGFFDKDVENYFKPRFDKIVETSEEGDFNYYGN